MKKQQQQITQKKSWDDEIWQSNFLYLCKEELSSRGIDVLSGFLEKRIMPWSFVGEVTTSNGSFFCKSVSDAAYFEPELTFLLNQISDNIVDVVSFSASDGWIITKGETQIGEPAQLLLVDILKDYAKLQILTINYKSELMKTGIPTATALKKVVKRLQNMEKYSIIYT